MWVFNIAFKEWDIAIKATNLDTNIKGLFALYTFVALGLQMLMSGLEHKKIMIRN